MPQLQDYKYCAEDDAQNDVSSFHQHQTWKCDF